MLVIRFIAKGKLKDSVHGLEKPNGRAAFRDWREFALNPLWNSRVLQYQWIGKDRRDLRETQSGSTWIAGSFPRSLCRLRSHIPVHWYLQNP